jgi:uncharacterized protein YjiK
MKRAARLGAVVGSTMLVAGVAGPLVAPASASTPLTSVDLSTYVRVGRYDLPEPTRTAAPANSLLAQEASSVTYDWDTDTLFVVGDGGTSVVQVSKTGQLINSMTLPPGSSPQGTEFYDNEGLTYIGGGQFVMTEERYRDVVKFTYVAGGTLTRAAAKTVKLGTTIGNIGLEGVSNDPQTGGFLVVKEKDPESIFQTNIDWDAGTATNGSPTTDESTNLFDPSLVGTNDFSDVYSLSNLSTLSGPDASHMLIISQESGKIVNVDRSGNVSSSLTIPTDPGSPLSVPDQTHEGVTMDNDGTLYEVSENGGGDSNHPQLWVYKHTDAPDLAPTGVLLNNTVTSIPENTSTTGGIKVADITVLDDGLGTNNLSLSGPDAASFEIVGGSLVIKPGTVLDYETKTTYNVTVNVDDPAVGSSPDASVNYTLNVSDVVNETPATGTLAITEVAPWSSGNSPVAADWWEVTNTGGTPVDITGWKMDDNSYSFGSAVALRGVTSIPAGGSAIFLESGSTAGPADATLINLFKSTWWGTASPPANVQFGTYGGSGVGLSTGGDAVNLFSAAGATVVGVSFAGSTLTAPYRTFDNIAGIGGTTNPAPVISQLSTVGTNHAFAAAQDANEIGSPGADFLPPTFSNVPFDITTEATGATTPVTFTAPTASDLVDGSRPVSCLPASGSSFGVGTTTVTCSASDTAGNSASTTFHVTVRDTTPPVVHVPADIVTTATGASTDVAFGPVTATDAVDGTTTATCSPDSPGPFPIGTTHVDCFTVDSHGNRGSAPFNVTVMGTPNVVATADPVTYGSPATITVSVTDPTGSFTPSGAVDVTVDGAPAGTHNLDGSGTATFSVSGLAAGSHAVSATYAGDARYTGYSSICTLNVSQASSTTNLSSDTNPSIVGDSVTLTATVTDADAVATGDVEFFDGGASIGSATLDGSGQATLTTSTLAVGSHAITATYSGDDNNTGSTSSELDQVVAPALAITSGATAPFVAGVPGSFTISAVGPSTPALSVAAVTGKLPMWVQVHDNGDGTATVSGTPPLTPAAHTYPAVVTATASGHTVTQSLSIVVGNAPALTSVNALTVKVGTAKTFTVHTTGYPKPAITVSGALPAGLTFTDRGNGTATFTGTAAPGTGGTYLLTLTATSAEGTATQTFTLTVNERSVFTSDSAVSFPQGVFSSFTVSTANIPTAAITESGVLPVGVTLVDNGDGTATLSGTPIPGVTVAKAYKLSLRATNAAGYTTQAFVLSVTQGPAFTSAAASTFKVGVTRTMTIRTTGFPKPAITEIGALPAGLTFTDNGNGTATLTGAAAPGSNGVYVLDVQASSVAGTADQTFTLTVS